MMMRAKEVLGLRVRSTDGEIGKVKDLLFDCEAWMVRYAVVDTWDWMPERHLIIPPAMLRGPEQTTRIFDVPLGKQAISEGAMLRTGETLSRRIEASVFEHFKLTPYWTVRVPGGAAMIADQLAGEDEESGKAPSPLRSFVETAGYEVVGSDGPIGHVSDFILGDETWSIAELLVNTKDWLRGGSAALSTRWSTGVHQSKRQVTVDRTRKEVEDDPGYHPVPTDTAMPSGHGSTPDDEESPQDAVQLRLELDEEEGV